MSDFVVDFYKDKDGNKPLTTFIRSLDTKMRAKVVANLHLLTRSNWQRNAGKIIIAGRRQVHMSDLQELTNELMKDEDFKREYEALQPEMDITRALFDARIQAGLTQSQLSEKTGISQADISRLEKGTRNPSLSLLKRLAEAMNSSLRIEFVPKKPTV